MPSRRAALLALLTLPMADVRMLANYPKNSGRLTVPLDQWKTVSFTLNGKAVEFTMAELFAILTGGQK